MSSQGGQVLAKPDMCPPAWVQKLSVLHDAAPADDIHTVRRMIRQELGGRGTMEDVFESFDETPLGSASIAQVRA